MLSAIMVVHQPGPLIHRIVGDHEGDGSEDRVSPMLADSCEDCELDATAASTPQSGRQRFCGRRAGPHAHTRSLLFLTRCWSLTSAGVPS